MNSDDPFFTPKSDDRTVIKPVPGGRRADIRRPQAQAMSPTTTSIPSGPLNRLGKLNPLENAASGLLALLAKLPHFRSYPDAEALKNQLAREIKTFQNEAIHNGVDKKTVYTARYVLCTALDEAALGTPWGQSSSWSQKSLLSSFHKEVSGGERFFKILKSLGENPGKNLHLLELMYLCLALGFQGRYRITQNGKDKLGQIKEWLYNLISRQRDSTDKALSPHWKGVVDQRNPLLRLVPIWVIGAIAAGLLATIFFGFILNLNHHSDPVFKRVFSFNVDTPPPQIVEAPIPPPPIIVRTEPLITLSQLLSTEIAARQVRVDETDKTSKATIEGDNLFRSGRADVNKNIIPLLIRIGESLNQLSGSILITGHSDSDPIKNARFPSNWHLSQSRADAVANIIKRNLDTPERVTVEGRADFEPIASNDSREGKARNRRVEIMLFR